MLPPAYVEKLGGRGVPLTETTFSALNVFVTVGLVAGLPVLMGLLAPRDERGPRADRDASARRRRPEMLAADAAAGDRSPTVSTGPGCWPTCSACRFSSCSLRHVSVQGLAALDLKAIIAGMIGLGLLLHRSPRSYLRAVEEGVQACGGIILQFPLYGGIMAMMEGSGLVRQLAGALTALGPPASVPISSFFAGCVINMFVPSGGGHWAVQGPVALEAGIQAGIPPGKMILSVAYGGEATDMLQPFWALPLLAITGRARPRHRGLHRDRDGLRGRLDAGGPVAFLRQSRRRAARVIVYTTRSTRGAGLFPEESDETSIRRDASRDGGGGRNGGHSLHPRAILARLAGAGVDGRGPERAPPRGVERDEERPLEGRRARARPEQPGGVGRSRLPHHRGPERQAAAGVDPGTDADPGPVPRSLSVAGATPTSSATRRRRPSSSWPWAARTAR